MNCCELESVQNFKRLNIAAINTLQAGPLKLWLAALFGQVSKITEDKTVHSLRIWRGREYYISKENIL